MEQKDLRDLISCPICFNYCTGKIYNCANGHVTCSECIKSINKCPTCRVKMAPASRNIALEQVLSTVLFPCKFAEAGCEALVPHSQLGEHQENCRHSRVPHICSHCNRDCGYEESRKTHLDLCPDNLLMCHHCEEFVARKDLPCHLWMKHSKPFQVRTCVTCGEKVLRAHMDKHNMKKHGIISMESSKEETVKEWEGTQCVSGLETQDGYRVTADCLINDVDAMEYFGSSRYTFEMPLPRAELEMDGDNDQRPSACLIIDRLVPKRHRKCFFVVRVLYLNSPTGVDPFLKDYSISMTCTMSRTGPEDCKDPTLFSHDSQSFTTSGSVAAVPFPDVKMDRYAADCGSVLVSAVPIKCKKENWKSLYYTSLQVSIHRKPKPGIQQEQRRSKVPRFSNLERGAPRIVRAFDPVSPEPWDRCLLCQGAQVLGAACTADSSDEPDQPNAVIQAPPPQLDEEVHVVDP